MKFLKGMVMGTMISAGVVYYYSEINRCAGRKMMKQGKKFMKYMGMM